MAENCETLVLGQRAERVMRTWSDIECDTASVIRAANALGQKFDSTGTESLLRGTAHLAILSCSVVVPLSSPVRSLKTRSKLKIAALRSLNPPAFLLSNHLSRHCPLRSGAAPYREYIRNYPAMKLAIQQRTREAVGLSKMRS